MACDISIHALLAESDLDDLTELRQIAVISIHALLAESDPADRSGQSDHRNFYPRSPCGERPLQVLIAFFMPEFLSTLSLRRATVTVDGTAYKALFLSTLSLRRATRVNAWWAWANLFLSTLSLRRATAKVHKTVGHFCAYETNFMGIASSC